MRYLQEHSLVRHEAMHCRLACSVRLSVRILHQREYLVDQSVEKWYPLGLSPAEERGAATQRQLVYPLAGEHGEAMQCRSGYLIRYKLCVWQIVGIKLLPAGLSVMGLAVTERRIKPTKKA